MSDSEEEIKKSLRKMKKKFPGMDEDLLEKELLPLQPGEELTPRTVKRRKRRFQ